MSNDPEPVLPFLPEAPARIRQKVEAGSLPITPPIRMFASYGSGEVCAGCDHVIQPDEIEYEFANGRSVRMHLGCAAIWDAERRRRDRRV